jgi:hypothetical protein
LNQSSIGRTAGGDAGRIATVQVKTGDKTGACPPVVGHGAFRYEVIHDWGRLPAGHVLGKTHGVTVCGQGCIHIAHTVGAGAKIADAVVVFDANGAFVRSWGAQHRGGAHGLHLSREGREEFLYLCDFQRHEFSKNTLDGKVLWQRSAPEHCSAYTSREEFKPTNVAVAPNGDLYVADGYGRSLIHHYDSRGEYIRSFGGAGVMSCPHGLIVDTRGAAPVLIVADRGNRRLQCLALDGRVQGRVTDEMRAPCHFHIQGDVIVVPDLESRVTLLDKHNRLITHLGEGVGYHGLRDKPREHFTPGQFVAPHSACFDPDGNIFVVEWVEVGRVTKLRKVA